MARRMVAAALLAAAMGSTSTPAAADPICVEVVVRIRPADPTIAPVRQCAYDSGAPTNRSGGGFGDEGPVYVGVWVEHS